MSFISGDPTWDLLLVIILCIVIIYGFIIGQAKIFKTLLSLYPAFFIADIVGGFLPSLFPNLKIAFINNNDITTLTLSQQTDSLQAIIITKMIIFLVFWILIILKTPFEIQMEENSKKIGNMFLHLLISLTFGLLLSSLVLLLLSGFSAFGGNPNFYILDSIIEESVLIPLFIQFAGIWLAIPGVVLVLSGFLHKPIVEESNDEEEVSEES